MQDLKDLTLQDEAPPGSRSNAWAKVISDSWRLLTKEGAGGQVAELP